MHASFNVSGGKGGRSLAERSNLQTFASSLRLRCYLRCSWFETRAGFRIVNRTVTPGRIFCACGHHGASEQEVQWAYWGREPLFCYYQ